MGVQLTPAIPSHRDQGEIRLVEAEFLPQPGQQLIHVLWAGGDQLDDVVAGVETGVQPAEETTQVLLAVVTGELIVG